MRTLNSIMQQISDLRQYVSHACANTLAREYGITVSAEHAAAEAVETANLEAERSARAEELLEEEADRYEA